MNTSRRAALCLFLGTMGLLIYSIPYSRTPQALPARADSIPIDTPLGNLANPFESPGHAVILEELGDNPDAVRQVVQSAVPNRSPEWSAQLMNDLPRAVREVADQSTAGELATRLRDAGARVSVHTTLDWFVERLTKDAATPIGAPSEVLDIDFLQTGRDAISELRASLKADGDESYDRELAKRAYLAWVTAEGRSLYQISCRPCHGTTGNGAGPAAAGFALRPANFRDPTSLAALSSGEMLWRIEAGATPLQSSAWDSAMPAWHGELDRELAWKIVLGELSTADAKPRTPNKPATRTVAWNGGRSQTALPTLSWIEWPVPEKPTPAAASDPAFIQRGKYVYYGRCMPCHGVTGRGDGPAADTMWPRPRDFTTHGFAIEQLQPKFKFRTTKQGWLPTDEDLYRTISRGLVGTAMEGWDGVLEPNEIWQVIAYLKTLSPAWNDKEHMARNPNDPAVVKEYTEFDGSSPLFDFVALEPPKITEQLLRDGEETFRRVQCWQCHGIEARGDGPALGQHHDDWGYRTWPQNLANPHNYKAGHSIKEIYRTFVTSLDGSVMPKFPREVMDPTDPQRGEYLQWALAAYVHHQVQPLNTARGRAKILVHANQGPPLLDPLDERWNRMRAAVVPLSGQMIESPRWGTPSVNQVLVKSTYDANSITVWLRWDDRRPNVSHEEPPVELNRPAEPSPLGPSSYVNAALGKKGPVVFEARDQMELQWPTVWPWTRRNTPHFYYGGEEAPTTIWRWQADRQGLEIAKHAVEIGGTQAERIECTASSNESGNNAVSQWIASGPNELRAIAPSESDQIQSRARWSNGAWTVVLSGPRSSDPLGDSPFHSKFQAIPLAIRVWDGTAGETQHRMAISSWVDLILIEPRPMWQHIGGGIAGLVVLFALWSWIRSPRPPARPDSETAQPTE